jgi:hypothetical protein
VQNIERCAVRHDIPIVLFAKGQRKEDLAAQIRERRPVTDGVVFMGKAQEKCTVYRTEKRPNPKTQRVYAWIVKSTALVNHYYFYCVDENFGPFFLKFCSYFPYHAKLCLNGHEYAKRQLEREGVACEALDNGIRSCADPKRLQQICNSLSAAKIDALLSKWLARLPHPYPAADRAAGYRYQLSAWQIELSLTQVLDLPVSGRIFFEQVIRENLDLGRPKQIQLIFDRGVTPTTPGPFRTRVITDGVIPSLHIDYKGTRIKQYHEGQALRTETTINNPRDFYIGKRLRNLPALRKIGASMPTGECGKYRASARISSWPKKLSNSYNGPAKWRASAYRPCVSPIPQCRPYGTPCCCSNCCRPVFPIGSSAVGSPNSWANRKTRSRRVA